MKKSLLMLILSVLISWSGLAQTSIDSLKITRLEKEIEKVDEFRFL